MAKTKGRRIKTLGQLAKLAEEKRAVYVPESYCFRHHQPAAWMINLSGHLLKRLMDQGLYIYKGK